jgi:enterochelin esterase-like enzyme
MMRHFAVVLLGVMSLLMSFVSGADAQSADDIPTCPSQEAMCRVNYSWTLARLRAAVGELSPGAGRFLAQDSQLTFAYRASSERFSEVGVLFYDEIRMQRVGESDWFAITLQIKGMDKAIISVGISEHAETAISYRQGVAAWRGENAPPPPPVNRRMQGKYGITIFDSAALHQPRQVHLYLPPNHDKQQRYPVVYMTEGASLRVYAPMIDYLIANGQIPPLIVVGAASAVSRDGRNLRGEEYVLGRNQELFEQHERFFTQEIRLWVERNFGASTERSQRIVFGVSNGGLYAATMTVRHPELYGTAFPFSAGASLGFEKPIIERQTIQLPLRIYSTAGTLEPIFHQSTREFADAYLNAGAEVVFVGHVAAHDDLMWQVELVNALKWAFE